MSKIFIEQIIVSFYLTFEKCMLLYSVTPVSNLFIFFLLQKIMYLKKQNNKLVLRKLKDQFRSLAPFTHKHLMTK